MLKHSLRDVAGQSGDRLLAYVRVLSQSGHEGMAAVVEAIIDLRFVPGDLPWSGHSTAPYEFLAAGVFRAVENHVPLIRVANSGISAVITPTGRIKGATDLFVRTAEVQSVEWPSTRTFYSKYGDIFSELCFVATVIGVLIAIFMLMWKPSTESQNTSKSKILLFAILLVVTLATSSAFAVDVERGVDGNIVGYGLKDLPENPDIAQQVDAGIKEIKAFRESDPAFDADRETLKYLNAIEAKLAAASPQRPLFPIEVHTSRRRVSNARAFAGGQILVYEKLFEDLDDESELVGTLAHETAHELHNDFLASWHEYKAGRAYYGRDGVMENSEAREAAADEAGVRLMYDAGWDPQGMLAHHISLYKRGVMERRGEPEFWDNHPRERERVEAIKAEIAKLPTKEGLIKDTPTFQQIKQKY